MNEFTEDDQVVVCRQSEHRDVVLAPGAEVAGQKHEHGVGNNTSNG